MRRSVAAISVMGLVLAVVFVSRDPGVGGAVVRVGGKSVVRCPLGSLGGVDWLDARFSPNGKLLALLPSSSVPTPRALFVFDLRTRRLRRLATLPSSSRSIGEWSPDSTRLALSGD